MMAPLPNTHVFHPRWAAHHRPTAVDTMTATCTIRRPGGTQGDFDPVTGTYPTTPLAAHYTGPCRVQVRPFLAADEQTGDQTVTVTGYLVTVELDASADTAVDDVLTFTAPGPHGDPVLQGRELVVDRVTVGSLAWERDIYCIDQLG